LLRDGPESLSESELLAVLISSGNAEKSACMIAEDILARFQSFRGMANRSFEDLMKIKGLGPVKVARIAAAFEIARRVVRDAVARARAAEEDHG